MTIAANIFQASRQGFVAFHALVIANVEHAVPGSVEQPRSYHSLGASAFSESVVGFVSTEYGVSVSYSLAPGL
jgi:hypothetical protein